MEIAVKSKQSYTIVDILSSNLDSTLVNTLKNILDSLINENKYDILVDFSNVEVVDTLALGCLITSNKECMKKGGQISLFGVNNDILMILYIIKLDKHINIYNNEKDALSRSNMLVKRRFKVV
ncbi:MAG: STAS domain-containing protein [Candidatus Gastranaerophilales bacterium]|nr:STAS domain-containing protein [Candidatus Gastranaerophilales bacterium]